MQISKIGSSNVMLPAAVAIAVWLMAGGARRLFLYWCLLFAGTLLLVAASKIAFVGWGIGIEEIDFTGFSGHAMRSAAIIPTLFYVIVRQQAFALRWPAVIAGVGVAALISLSRVQLHFHSVSEALSGSLLGLAACLCFIWQAENTSQPGLSRTLLACSFVLLLTASFSKPVPTEDLIASTALWLSGHPAAVAEHRRQSMESALPVN
ncbi:phosphatase PAP2 family protein [Collimonas pratensis]|nr:phosphatase PAP2 family protein [Collimonas pratensis]NKI69470.1 phosphatase PAP2 family protein [Collimonas pratensis]